MRGADASGLMHQGRDGSQGTSSRYEDEEAEVNGHLKERGKRNRGGTVTEGWGDENRKKIVGEIQSSVARCEPGQKAKEETALGADGRRIQTNTRDNSTHSTGRH